VTEHIKYINSYGQEQLFPKTSKAIGSLRTRRINTVIPETLEIIDRIHRRNLRKPTDVSPIAVGFELGVKMDIIMKIFARLRNTGLMIKDSNKFIVQRTVNKDDYTHG